MKPTTEKDITLLTRGEFNQELEAAGLTNICRLKTGNGYGRTLLFFTEPISPQLGLFIQARFYGLDIRKTGDDQITITKNN